MLAHEGLARTELFQAEEMLFLETELQLLVPQDLSLVLVLGTAEAAAARRVAAFQAQVAQGILVVAEAAEAAWQCPQALLLAPLALAAQAAAAMSSSSQSKENQ